MTTRAFSFATALLALAGSVTLAQQPSTPPAQKTMPSGHNNHENRPQLGNGEVTYNIMPEGMPGLWWHIPGLAQKIGLTPDQQKRMDDTVHQSRPLLFHQHEDLHKQRDLLQTMLDANPSDSAKIREQLHLVAQARAAEEEARDKMLLSIRDVMTPDQWTRLQAESHSWQTQHKDDRHWQGGRDNGQPNGPPRGRPRPAGNNAPPPA